MSIEKDPKLHLRNGALAVPEVLTGEMPETDELEEDQDEIRYDNVAVPEIHLSAAKPKK